MTEDIILGGLIGSHAYGTNLPDSDLDYMSVVIPDEYSIFGVKQWGQSGTKCLSENTPEGVLSERTAYDVRKFIHMCTKMNPNVIPLLYLREYSTMTKYGQRILDNRAMFNSKLAYKTFMAYAQNQIDKMGDLGQATGRMGEKRKAIRTKFGYDTKYAMHSIRLMRMCNEFLRWPSGGFNVCREGIDSFDLIEIRLGKYSLDKIKSLHNDLFDKASEALAKSDLPEEPDYEKINNFTLNLLKDYLYENYSNS